MTNAAVRFRLIETLGRPDVYLAQLEKAEQEAPEPGPRRQVVLRLVSLSGRFEEERERVRARAQILEALDCPWLVFGRDLVQYRQRTALVSDYVPGADLEHVQAALELVGERFPIRAALSVGGGIFAAIAAAADAIPPVPHGALRTSAVRLTLRGGVRITDYNLPASDSSEATVRSELHVAPERLLGGESAIAGDVYAAASLVTELLTGRPLSAQVIPDLQRRAVEELLAPLRQQHEREPELMEAIDLLSRALDTRIEARPAPQKLQEALDRAAGAVTGETLPAFTGRLLPELDAILGRMSLPAEGIFGPSRAIAPGIAQGALSIGSQPVRYLLPLLAITVGAALCSAIATWMLADTLGIVWGLYR